MCLVGETPQLDLEHLLSMADHFMANGNGAGLRMAAMFFLQRQLCCRGEDLRRLEMCQMRWRKYESLGDMWDAMQSLSWQVRAQMLSHAAANAYNTASTVYKRDLCMICFASVIAFLEGTQRPHHQKCRRPACPCGLCTLTFSCSLPAYSASMTSDLETLQYLAAL